MIRDVFMSYIKTFLVFCLQAVETPALCWVCVANYHIWIVLRRSKASPHKQVEKLGQFSNGFSGSAHCNEYSLCRIRRSFLLQLRLLLKRTIVNCPICLSSGKYNVVNSFKWGNPLLWDPDFKENIASCLSSCATLLGLIQARTVHREPQNDYIRVNISKVSKYNILPLWSIWSS